MSADRRRWVWDTAHASGVHSVRREAVDGLFAELRRRGPGTVGELRAVAVTTFGDVAYLELTVRRAVAREGGDVGWLRG